MRRVLLVTLACCAPALAAPLAAAAVSVRPIGPPAPLTALVFAPGTGSARVYAASRDTFWRSDDNGVTWSAGAKLEPARPTCSYSVSPLDADLVYTGDCQAMSRDGGRTWTFPRQIDTTPQIDAAGTLYSREYDMRGLLHRCTPDESACADVQLPGADLPAVDPASSGLLVDGLFRSADGGARWSPISLPTPMTAAAFAFDGRAPGRLLAAGHDSDGHELLAVSPDGGLTWGPVHPVPLASKPEETTIVRSGGSGGLARVWLTTSAGTVWTADGGATFHPPQNGVPVGAPTVDPDDGTHAFYGDLTLLYETRDAGASWTLRNAPQFGYQPYVDFTGSASVLYARMMNRLWSSRDTGLTWAPVPAFAAGQALSVLASREDPLAAYAVAAVAGQTGAAVWKTVDGGASWDARAAPAYTTMPYLEWIDSGNSDWVTASGELSHDGGRTWNEINLADACFINFTPISPNSADGASNCDRFFVADPLRAPWDQSFSTARSVLLDRAAGIMISLDPIGRISADWTFTAPCFPAATACSGPVFTSEGDGDVTLAGGHVTVAYAGKGALWVMRDWGRWWRILVPTDVPGGQKAPLRLFGSFVAYEGLYVPLAAPVLAAPTVSSAGGALHCATALTADDADLAYAWRRNGSVAAGSGADRPLTAGDAGGGLACVVTAGNPWGTSTAVSPAFVPASVNARARRLTLTGSASTHGLLRCGAAAHVSWLRSGRLIAGAHAPTHRVAPLDEGHALACRFHPAGGTVELSPAVRVPRPHGGRAVPAAATP